MSIKSLQDYTYYSKYARYNAKAKRRETWNEAVDRVFSMHYEKYPQCSTEIEWAADLIKAKKVLGSQRALQFGGTPIKKKNARMYNCTVSFCDRLRFFQECFWLLLCGCGTGFSVQQHHVDKLPPFSTKIGTKDKVYFTIEDTIEGWADAIGVLLATYFPAEEFKEWEGHTVEFDYSSIRPKGSTLASGVGKAPGPEPLKRSLEIIRNLLQERVEMGLKKLRPIDAYDIVMHASDAVLSGGVRRSATICIFSLSDEEMIKAKTGNWFIDNPQRGRSNNSALLLRSEVTKEQFFKLMESVKEYGEPGFYWSDSTEQLPNPCVVGDTLIATNNGLQMAESLVDKPFKALVEGQHYCSQGFWQTGVKSVIQLTFATGRQLRVTHDHKILTTNGWKEAGALTKEDQVVIHNHRSNGTLIGNDHLIDQTSPDFALGYCLGNFLSDGNVSKNAAQMKWWGEDKEVYRAKGLDFLETAGLKNNHHKNDPNTDAEFAVVESAALLEIARQRDCWNDDTRKKYLSNKGIEGSWSYLAGLVAAYFDADGTVAFNPEKGSSLRFCSSQINNLRNIQIVLNAMGIYSKIYEDRRESGMRPMPDGDGGHKYYWCEAVHELVISCDSIGVFAKMIPILNEAKKNSTNKILNAYKRTPNRTNFVDSVDSIEHFGMMPVYDATVEDVHAFDANGVYVHNCVEIGMWPVDVTTGKSGWQFCNLCEINGKKIKCKEDFAIAARGAAIIGTLQAGYDSFPYLGETTENIVRREALLGVSITGMMDSPDVIFNEKTQREMAALVLETNEWMAKLIGINPAARATCVKPAGTTSCVLGTGSGIHPHHAKRYFRRVQANNMEPVLQWFKQFNPHAVEKSVWSANKTDEVVTFCVEVPDGAKTKNDLSAIELLEIVKLTQKNWVTSGRRDKACTQPWLTHNVSNTINVRPDEWEVVAKFIYDNRKWFAGVSLLPSSGDLDYVQAPMCNVLNPKEILAEYGDGALLASGLIVDGLHAFENNLWIACDAVLGLGKAIEDSEIAKLNWIRRVKQFADRYCDGDARKCCYLMKHVNNWKIWLDLKREYVDVDYTQMFEETDETKPLEEIACAGGKCELPANWPNPSKKEVA